MLIYCSHKYGGKRENKAAAQRKIAELQAANKHHTYVSPIHAFGWGYKLFSYEDGIQFCLDLLERCDELYVLSEPSKGVVMEVCRARQLCIPAKYAKGLSKHYIAFDPAMEIDHDFNTR